MAKYTNDELLDGMGRILTRFLERQNWHSGESIATLRGRLKRGLDATIIHESANPQHLKDALIALQETRWNELVDLLDLECRFPDMQPQRPTVADCRPRRCESRHT